MGLHSSTPWPDLALLELLVAIDSTGSLSEASRRVGVSQPNASRTLRRVERTLGLALVEADTRGSRLTPHGVLVAEWAQSVLDPARALLVAVEGLRTDSRGHLAVAASRTIAEYAVPAWLALLRSEQPQVLATLTVDNSSQVCDLVLDHACELGFIESPGVPKSLRHTTIGVDELVVVVAPSHPWTRRRRRPVTAAELAATPLVVRESGSGTRATAERALTAFDRAAPALELASNEAVRIAVASGAGPAILSPLAVASALASGQLTQVAVEGVDLRRRFRAVWSRSRTLAPAAGELLRIARIARPSPSVRGI
ncbi:MAG: LysR family transcriptional regulator [Phycicoccus sp.]|nr:LysR family transcriptional regulator [Phycicoccus sp.]